jgi:hypothetical protein
MIASRTVFGPTTRPADASSPNRLSSRFDVACGDDAKPALIGRAHDPDLRFLLDLPPRACAAGFESGDLAAWSAAVR